MANIAKLGEDYRGNSVRVPPGNISRPISDKNQRNSAILRLVNGKEYTYAQIAHKLCISISTSNNVVWTVKKNSLIRGDGDLNSKSSITSLLR